LLQFPAASPPPTRPRAYWVGAAMAAFKHILVPTDFGEPANCALDVAVTLAARFASELTLLHAIWLPQSAYTCNVEALYWTADDVAIWAKKELDAALSKVAGRYPKGETVIATGEPWRTILDVAKERGADVIVMGTHGRSRLSHVLLGSVAEQVVRLSPIPVVTVSGKDERKVRDSAIARTTVAKLA
jgi:nucleotide-binding universal stress UspA family protein